MCVAGSQVGAAAWCGWHLHRLHVMPLCVAAQAAAYRQAVLGQAAPGLNYTQRQVGQQ